MPLTSVPGILVPGAFWPGSAELGSEAEQPTPAPGSCALLPALAKVTAGTAVTLGGQFTNATGGAVAPDTVTLVYALPGEAATSLEWPSGNELENLGSGIFQYVLDTTGLDGRLTYALLGTGACAASSPIGRIVVNPLPAALNT